MTNWVNHKGVPPAEESLRQQCPQGKHSRQDREHIKAIREAHRPWQGGEERGVWSQVQQHTG